MKVTNTFIRVAEDCPAVMGLVPAVDEGKTSIARLHYEILTQHPYEFDIEAFNFEVFCRKNAIPDERRDVYFDAFKLKSHPCMRTSPLTKTFGFGAHYNSAGKIAIYPVDSKAYQKFLLDPNIRIEMAMRKRRAKNQVLGQTTGANPSLRPKTLQSCS